VCVGIGLTDRQIRLNGHVTRAHACVCVFIMASVRLSLTTNGVLVTRCANSAAVAAARSENWKDEFIYANTHGANSGQAVLDGLSRSLTMT